MGAWILIVDDEPKILEMMTIFLENEGYRVSTFSDGLSALEAVKQNVPDLVLLDIRLRGMDGWEVHDAIRASERTKDVPIIILTAKADETLSGHQNGRSAGNGTGNCTVKDKNGSWPTQLIYKPFSPDELLERVSSALDR